MKFEREKVVDVLCDNLEQWVGWRGYTSDNLLNLRKYVKDGIEREMNTLEGVVNDPFPFKADGSNWQFFYPIDPNGKKLVPFDTCKELIDWFRGRVGIKASGIAEPLVWVKNKKTGIYALIDGLDFDENHLPVHLLGEWIMLERLSERFTLLDGTPIGKRILRWTRKRLKGTATPATSASSTTLGTECA